MTKTTDNVEMTLEEWQARARELFGEDGMDWKFVCPVCGTEQSGHNYKAVGAPSSAVGFSCIGRWIKGSHDAMTLKSKGQGPCNYAGGGLFRLNPVTVVDLDGERHQVFAFAEPSGG